MQTKKYVGGGVSLGVRTNKFFLKFVLFIVEYIVATFGKLSAGMFFFWKADALEIGGFPETHLAGEDVLFAKTLKAHGTTLGKSFLNLRTVRIITLDRKDVGTLQIIKAFYVGGKAFVGAKVTKQDLDYWYNPKR